MAVAIRRVTQDRNGKGKFKYRATWRIGKKAFQKIFWAADDAEAQQLLLHLQGEVDEALSWNEAAKRFLEAKPHVCVQYQQEISRVVKALINQVGDRTIPDTTLQLFANFIRTKASASCGRTANKYRTTLLTIARWARGQGLLESNPL